MINDKDYQDLVAVLKEYHGLNDKLNHSETIANLDQYTETKREIKKIQELASVFQDYQNVEKQLEEWKTIRGQDKNLNALATKEIVDLEIQITLLEQKIIQIHQQKNVLKTTSNNTIIEIRGAAGGKEGNVFASDLLEMYLAFCKRKGWKYEIWELHRTEGVGLNFVSFCIKNADAYFFLRHEGGVHRVQRVPKTENSGRIHTSTATVAVLEEKTASDMPIDNKDLRIDTFRSSGAGGQHVNTTDSAVRVTHLPSGLAISCQDGRSQHDNKDKALKVLRARLFKMQQTSVNKQNVDFRNQQIGEGDRSEKIRTYNFLQNRVTDHRINFTIKNIEQIMSGKIDKLLEKLNNSHLDND